MGVQSLQTEKKNIVWANYSGVEWVHASQVSVQCSIMYLPLNRYERPTVGKSNSRANIIQGLASPSRLDHPF